MYTLVNSYLKSVITHQPYKESTTLNITMGELLYHHLDGYLTLSNPTLKGNVYLKLDDIRKLDIAVDQSLTVTAWLRAVGNRRLPTVTTKPVYNTRKVYARDAVLSGFHVDPCEPYKPHTTNASIGNKTNIHLQVHEGIRRIIQRRSLTTVNGLLHRNFPFGEGLQIHEGGSSSMYKGTSHVAVWSFEHIGDIQQFALTPENVNKVLPVIPLSESFIINLGQDISDKSVILSLGGFPYINPDFITIVNPEIGLIKVDSGVLDITQCIQASRHLIDLTDLGVFDSSDTKLNESFGWIDTRLVESDEVVLKWLTLAQSFIAIIDTPNLSVTEHSVHWTGVHGAYEYHENPYHVLMDHYGRCPEYWVKRQHDAWVILVEDPEYSPLLTMTTNQDEVNFRNFAVPYHVELTLPMTFLEISTTVKQ